MVKNGLVNFKEDKMIGPSQSSTKKKKKSKPRKIEGDESSSTLVLSTKKTKKDHQQSSSGSSDTENKKFMQEDFNLRQSKLIEGRLYICRQWLVLALLYYILKSAIITYPLLIRKFKKEANRDGYEDGEGYDPTVEFV